MKNLQTPRTLSESSFVTGYPAVVVTSRRERIAGVLLAVVIGVVMAALLAHWWAQ